MEVRHEAPWTIKVVAGALAFPPQAGASPGAEARAYGLAEA